MPRILNPFQQFIVLMLYINVVSSAGLDGPLLCNALQSSLFEHFFFHLLTAWVPWHNEAIHYLKQNR